MILKGGSVGGGGLAAHLQSEENEAVRLVAAEGLLSHDIDGLVAEVRARAVGITRKGAFHIAVSAQPGEKWGFEEQQAAIAAVLREYRAEGAPYFVIGHEKDARGTGRDEHLHIVISRVDGRARVVDDGYTRVRNEKLARCLEHDLGHRLTIGKHNRAVMNRLRAEGRADVADWLQQRGADTAPRPTADLSHAEAQQQKRTHLTKAAVAADVLAAFRAADSGKAFRAALADKGYSLAQGREAGAVMLVDPAGGSHELTRLLRSAMKAEGEKLPAKEARAQTAAKLADLDWASLPGLAETTAQAREGETAAEKSSNPIPGGTKEAGTDQVETPTAATLLAELTGEKVSFTEADVDRALRCIADENVRDGLKAEVRTQALTVAEGKNGWRGTTRDMAEVEVAILDRSEAMIGRRNLAVDGETVETGIRAFAAEFKTRDGHDLNAEQIDAIRHVTSGADLVTVTGVAGAGKTTMAEGAARIWKAEGYRLEGMALSAVAAAKLGESGISSDTIAARLLRWDRAALAADLQRTGSFTDETRAMVLRSLDGWREAAAARGEPTEAIEAKRHQVEAADRLGQLDRSTRRWLNGWLKRQASTGIDSRTVLMVDEAGMVNHRLMARILGHAERAGAKVVLIGDAEQIQPIEAGGAFRLVSGIAETAELRQVIRQRDAWQRQATEAFASGSPEKAAEAVTAYAAHGMVHTGILGTGDTRTLHAEAADKLGRELTDDDRRHIDQIAAYVGARVEAGTLWREIQEDGGEPEEHPLYAEFKDAQGRRNAAVVAIAADLGTARPWLVRYRVDPEGFAADLAFAECMSRAEAEAAAPDRAETLGLVGLEPDVVLSVDWRSAAREQLFEDWQADLRANGAAVSRIILAYSRADVARLNADARIAMRAAGHLSGADVMVATEGGPMAMAIGDRIMTLANDRKMGVQNGATGRLEEIGLDDKTGAVVLTVATDDGRKVTIDTGTYAAIQHGYAATLHKSQGVTVDRAWVLNHALIDRHLAYVAMSRHRQSVKVFSAAIDARTNDALARQYSRGRTKNSISDYRDPRELLRSAASATPREEQHHVRTASRIRRLSDTFGLPHALRKLDLAAASAGAASRRADRVSDLQRGAVARHREGTAVLLPGNAGSRLDDQGARDLDALRRAGVRGRTVTTPTAALQPDAATSATRRGEQIMRASIKGNAENETYIDQQLVNDRATTQAGEESSARSETFGRAYSEFAELSFYDDRTPDEDAEREALADAMRAIARDEATLRRWAPEDAGEIMRLAEKRDQEHLNQSNVRAVGDHPIHSPAENFKIWTSLHDKMPDKIKDVVAHPHHNEIKLADGQILHDLGSRLTTDSPMTRETADVMAKGAEAKGWKEVTLTGTDAEKRIMAEAMVAQGLTVTNPEMQSYIKTLDKAQALAADRQALAAARLQPDLTDPAKFAQALSAYQYGLVSGAATDQLRHQRADLLARGEAIHQATNGMGKDAAHWAAEAKAVDAAQPVNTAQTTEAYEAGE